MIPPIIIPLLCCSFSLTFLSSESKPENWLISITTLSFVQGINNKALSMVDFPSLPAGFFPLFSIFHSCRWDIPYCHYSQHPHSPHQGCSSYNFFSPQMVPPVGQLITTELSSQCLISKHVCMSIKGLGMHMGWYKSRLFCHDHLLKGIARN